MYLSRIRLDAGKRETMTALSNPGKFHGAVESAFPEERRSEQLSLFGTPSGGEQSRKLWRVDSLGDEIYLLVLSENLPELASAVRQFGYPGEAAETKDYSKLTDRITAGSRWQFRLTANPTVSRKKNPGDDRGKVMAHVTVAHQEQWLAERAAANGFSLEAGEYRVTKSRIYKFQKQGRSRPVTLLSVTFDGILTVADPEKFRGALLSGIGRGKAYGNGLLTVVKVRDDG